MEGKWIRFDEQPILKGQKTKRFNVVNKESGVQIGYIAWYGPFRKYSLFVGTGIVFEEKCLRDIATALVTLTEEHKAGNKKRAQELAGITKTDN